MGAEIRRPGISWLHVVFINRSLHALLHLPDLSTDINFSDISRLAERCRRGAGRIDSKRQRHVSLQQRIALNHTAA